MKKTTKTTKTTKKITKPATKKVEAVKVENTQAAACSYCACTAGGVIRWILTPIIGIISTLGFTMLISWLASVSGILNHFVASCTDQMCVFNLMMVTFIISLALAFIPTFYIVRWISPKRKTLSAFVFLLIMAIFIALRLYGIL